MAAVRVLFDRYERVYHRPTGWYLNVLAPGPTPESVLVADSHASFPASRATLRRLRWYERLLNR